MRYIKELDSIRAVAVLAVMASHWVTIRNPFVSRLLHYGGPVGVDIFFVLSGFLITWILFTNKKEIEGSISNKANVLRNFYIRRTLRIFPIYYLVIIILLFFSKSSGTQLASSYPYFLTYTSNFYFFNLEGFDGILSHLWSLAVEEQFYLLWPTIVLFIHSRYLLHIIYVFIGLGIISQLFFFGNDMGTILTFTCFDAFGLGALLAWQLVYSTVKMDIFYKWTQRAAIIALPLFVAGLLQNKWPAMPLLRTLVSVLTLFTITYIIFKKNEGQRLWFNFIWSNKVLIFIGKISYGIYLYHNLIPHYSLRALRTFLNVTPESMLPYKLGYIVMLGVNGLILIILAWLSWILIEKPILRLKKHFEYNKVGQSDIQPVS